MFDFLIIFYGCCYFLNFILGYFPRPESESFFFVTWIFDVWFLLSFGFIYKFNVGSQLFELDSGFALLSQDTFELSSLHFCRDPTKRLYWNFVDLELALDFHSSPLLYKILELYLFTKPHFTNFPLFA